MPEASQPLIGVFGADVGDAEIAAMTPSVRSGWMGMGPKVREFEEMMAARLGQPMIMTNSGSSALHLAVAALALPAGSEIIVPAFTWIACAQAVVSGGHRVIFADVDLETYNIRLCDVEAAKTPKSRAAMVVHYAGTPVDMRAIASLDLPIIEDAAHAVASSYEGRPCGTLGTTGIFSFDSVKNIATPDAGGLTSNDEELLDRARGLRYCGLASSGFDAARKRGRWWEHEVAGVFPRVVPNDVSASVGLAQLQRLTQNQERRREIWDIYSRELAGVSWLKGPPEPSANEAHSRFTYLVRVLDGRRDELALHLLDRGIYTTLRYHPLHLAPVFRSTARLPNCEVLAEQGLNLPLHPRMTETDVDRVITALINF
jgi:aminotransferase